MATEKRSTTNSASPHAGRASPSPQLIRSDSSRCARTDPPSKMRDRNRPLRLHARYLHPFPFRAVCTSSEANLLLPWKSPIVLPCVRRPRVVQAQCIRRLLPCKMKPPVNVDAPSGGVDIRSLWACTRHEGRGAHKIKSTVARPWPERGLMSYKRECL